MLPSRSLGLKAGNSPKLRPSSQGLEQFLLLTVSRGSSNTKIRIHPSATNSLSMASTVKPVYRKQFPLSDKHSAVVGKQVATWLQTYVMQGDRTTYRGRCLHQVYYGDRSQRHDQRSSMSITSREMLCNHATKLVELSFTEFSTQN